jgi:hypothetical protein
MRASLLRKPKLARVVSMKLQTMKSYKLILPSLIAIALVAGCGKSTPDTSGDADVQAVLDQMAASSAPPTDAAPAAPEAAPVAPPAEGALTRLGSQPGGKVRIEGTSSMHDWQVEGKLIGGYMEVGPGFPLEPGQAVTPGKVQATVDAFIPVRSMISLKKDGSPYDKKMDAIMYEKLKMPSHPRIEYRLSEMALKESPKAADAPYVFDSKGELVVAGVTNSISMPVRVTPLGDNKIKIAGETTVKMTQFGIEPPAPAIAMGLIKTGDDVKLMFEWIVGRSAPAATASN